MKKRIIPLILAASLLFCGCSDITVNVNINRNEEGKRTVAVMDEMK